MPSIGLHPTDRTEILYKDQAIAFADRLAESDDGTFYCPSATASEAGTWTLLLSTPTRPLPARRPAPSTSFKPPSPMLRSTSFGTSSTDIAIGSPSQPTIWDLTTTLK
ncbi:hypothetical protein GCK32_003697 [Trichostrongylus colubriformis]|uniref:Uncharacterized protein n=1 Tax=Trichostrongylus colubriformis TaxID=6319 RepID=A0AAN8J3N8_TRICO